MIQHQIFHLFWIAEKFGVFFRTDKVTAFNPCLECNYTVERSNIDGYIGFCRWTYTFTNADYDAAVARGPMKEQ